MSIWQPAKYLAFENNRLQPAIDLLNRVPHILGDDIHIVDLGAGTGNMAKHFLNRWPNARIAFVDNSEAMLERGKNDHKASFPADTLKQFEYYCQNFEEFEPTSKVDLIYSNSAFHWVDYNAHTKLLPRLFTFLKPGGTLAFQIPDTRNQMSHILMKEAASQAGFIDCVRNVRWATCERDPDYYYELAQKIQHLQTEHSTLQMWSTSYTQILQGKNPVADFTASTGFTPYIAALGGQDTADAKHFDTKYRELLLNAYPKQSDGSTIFNFKRFFFVQTKYIDNIEN